jgi:hypothetical protein
MGDGLTITIKTDDGEREFPAHMEAPLFGPRKSVMRPVPDDSPHYEFLEVVDGWVAVEK